MDRFILYPLFLVALAAIGFLGWQLFEYANALPTWQAALTQSNNSLRETKNALSQANANIVQANAIIAEQSRKLDSTAAELAIRSNALQAAHDELRKASDTITEQNQRLRMAGDLLNTTRNERNVALQSLEVERQNLAAEKQTTRRQASRITSLQADLQSKDGQITQLNGQVSRQRTQISQQNSTISSLRSQIRTKDATISRLENQQVKIPACSTNYYTAIGGQLSCVARNSAEFQATQTESRDINLPQTGRVTLKINRSGEVGSEQSMDLLEHAVKTIEEYMGQPIPLQGREIRLDFVKALELDGDFAGVHKGTHMEILQEYDSAAPPGRDGSLNDLIENILGISQESDATSPLAAIIAHEVAHYYWTDERVWLHEGAADFLALYSENRRTGAPIQPENQRCAQVSNIRQLEAKRYEQGDAGYRCNYSLGEGLFVDLYNAMSATAFRQSFRELYAAGQNKLAGVHQVRQAYPGSWSIIDRYYGYREKPEAHWPNGEFLGYYTWEENGEYYLTTRNGRPCATSLRMNDTPRGWRVRETRDECYYIGAWSDEGDLLVTIDGTTYRAVETEISGPPRYGNSGAVPPGQGSPAPTVIPSRGELWNS